MHLAFEAIDPQVSHPLKTESAYPSAEAEAQNIVENGYFALYAKTATYTYLNNPVAD